MTSPPTCPRCDGPLDPYTGLCPRCLAEGARGGAPGHAGSGGPEIVFTTGVRRPEPPSIEELAPHFPNHELLERIGSGGMGAVYRARHKGLDRDMAIKVLHGDVAGTSDTPGGPGGFSERFQREARTLAGLRHDGIVTVHDFGRAGPWFFLSMEFVDGIDLRQMVRARELEPREALAIVIQICETLQYAHDQGVVHRDIKPENILVDTTGRVKVLDFGLAKLLGAAAPENLTHTHQVMGTPHYMAPEQWEHPLTVDHRADIFSLGVVFYELLTGELPVGRFAAPSAKVAIDVRLDEVVLRTLEREPERRYQKVSEVRDDVVDIESGAPPAPPAPSRVAPREHARATASRHLERASRQRRWHGRRRHRDHTPRARWDRPLVIFVAVMGAAYALMIVLLLGWEVFVP